jgi:hypothetical protein
MKKLVTVSTELKVIFGVLDDEDNTIITKVPFVVELSKPDLNNFQEVIKTISEQKQKLSFQLNEQQ